MEIVKPDIIGLIKCLIKDGEPMQNAKVEYSNISPEDKRNMIQATKEVDRLEKALSNSSQENRIKIEKSVSKVKPEKNKIKDKQEIVEELTRE